MRTEARLLDFAATSLQILLSGHISRIESRRFCDELRYNSPIRSERRYAVPYRALDEPAGNPPRRGSDTLSLKKAIDQTMQNMQTPNASSNWGRFALSNEEGATNILATTAMRRMT
jgi:hypothetical protein